MLAYETLMSKAGLTDGAPLPCRRLRVATPGGCTRIEDCGTDQSRYSHARLVRWISGVLEHTITRPPGTLPTLAVALEYTQLYPVDTAIVERGFSIMNFHKTKNRNLLGDTLRDEMEIDINCPQLRDWNPGPALSLFKSGRRARDLLSRFLGPR